ncbi:MAG: rhodanese-related sulfurtransferase [Pseudomonadota bacterium]|nr:rhodanese-related sulfurtransferase [Pseudomonadota bacterium]
MQNKLIVAALYCFVSLDDIAKIRQEILSHISHLDIKGTLLLANEGINGTVAGSRESITILMKTLESLCDLTKIEYKESYAYSNPFLRLKVKLKREIVTLGVKGIDPTSCVGTYVEPKNWNEILDDKEVLVLDTRNDYEFEIGSFQGAVNPETNTFREFPRYVSENLSTDNFSKVAMFCTGGIRCEKASSFMLKHGFTEVYHLKGGILKYLEEIPESESKWYGECFVFDERVAVTHGLAIGSYDQCYGCRYPITENDKKSKYYIKGVSCPKCYAKTDDNQKIRFSERQRQIELAKKRGLKHLGEQYDIR